ncbi:TetR/AcrR family transcriptional regulator [Mycolicibacillus parakoreensis]|uniref:TetR/AcrR family transcriptional regulator n=1 Tax=Mycolicibacillus parakoreensis TaxID=1069221 RepID=A0ABY3U2Q0_9MYCO|nr:TetR/AcrR family transcriptional regulator [Mycolicibacillus parakoreensis]MCV7315729.1 TetR/AcrR family transcriptional regulator [Mycolicibacillus parakoreensis]ULN51837.1 TetR/AcrR family transcriptional regulator [Mycolicibacillus parakoreensis]
MTWGNQYRRSDHARRAILAAALELCRETGYGRLSIEAIARRAGVGKQTIYRWWPTKGALLLEALEEVSAPAAVFPDTGDLAADLSAQMAVAVEYMFCAERGPALLGVFDAAHHDPALADRLLTGVIAPRDEAGKTRLRAAVAAGDLPADTDVEMLFEQLYAPLYYRMLVTRQVPDQQYLRRHLTALLGDRAPKGRAA